MPFRPAFLLHQRQARITVTRLPQCAVTGEKRFIVTAISLFDWCHGDHYGNETFAQCLGVTPTTCSPGQGCRVIYTTDWHVLPTIGCSSTCPTFSQASPLDSLACPYGGHTSASLRQCDACCTDDACVDAMTTQLLTHAPVICPKRCALSHASDCWNNVDICQADEFCELTVVGHRTITGRERWKKS
ncbi:hypothetical protein ElyMa_003799600 [Elysia marginata]|uniref:Uncharacterized protein n=1 Tax=Elysia marginata TaxID=1093978 RepID=A0AAV4FCD7_9GAST|nr:hypothetical protein ElyMa_003799600 [Elysia marginata]